MTMMKLKVIPINVKLIVLRVRFLSIFLEIILLILPKGIKTRSIKGLRALSNPAVKEIKPAINTGTTNDRTVISVDGNDIKIKILAIINGNPIATSFRAVLGLPAFLTAGRKALTTSILPAIIDGNTPPIAVDIKPVIIPKPKCQGLTINEEAGGMRVAERYEERAEKD